MIQQDISKISARSSLASNSSAVAPSSSNKAAKAASVGANTVNGPSPICYQVGDDWVAGKVNIAQEHFITNFVVQRSYQMIRSLPINHKLPKVLAVCPADEQHQIGLLYFVLFLREKGFEVI